MSRLLVSVRNSGEAEAALLGGASIVDIKEPSRGSLGRADLTTIEEIVSAVGGRVPVSAAMGELSEGCPERLPRGISFFKWGLAGQANSEWRQRLGDAVRKVMVTAPDAVVVTVAYADWDAANASALEDVCDYVRCQGGVFLLDTFSKSLERTLFDYLSISEIIVLSRRLRSSNVRVALAGSLGRNEIAKLLPAEPAWFAVRGAVCDGGRAGTVSAGKVRELVNLIGRPNRGN
ncbi:MAG: (5-formylfuran-3-yl)methyl phosphate synthase [Candidatus Acidiferrum sp.]